VTSIRRDCLPPTDDDVSITRDGRRLDTPEKVIAFLAKINAERETAARVADPDDFDPDRILAALVR